MKIAWYRPKIAIEIKYPMKKNSPTQANASVMKNTARKILNMPRWAYLRANGDNALAVFDRCALGVAIELDVRLDEFDGPIGAGHDRLRRGARKPIDHRAARDQPQQERRMQQRQVPLGDHIGQAVGQHHDDRKDQRRRADNGRADQHRLGRGLERVARAVVFFQEVLALFEVGIEAELLLDFVASVGLAGERRQFKDRLRVVGHRAIRINRDRHRPHSQEAKRDEAERKHRGREHELLQAVRTDSRRRQFPSGRR